MGHQHLPWTPPAWFSQSCSPMPATAPSRKLTGPCSLYSKTPPTVHVKGEFLWMVPATPGNALNVSYVSSLQFREQYRQGGEPLLHWARGVQRHIKTLRWLS